MKNDGGWNRGKREGSGNNSENENENESDYERREGEKGAPPPQREH